MRTGAKARILAVLGAVLMLGTMLAPAATAADKPKARKVLTEPRIADQTKPGTVLVLLDIVAKVQLPQGKLDVAAFLGALANDPALADLFRAGRTDDAFNGVINKYVKADPNQFFEAIQVRSLDAQAGGQGSGAVVTPDGYVVTNAHVVKMSDDQAESALIQSVLPILTQDIEEMKAQFEGITLSDSNAKTLEDAYIAYVAQGFEITDRKDSVSVIQGVANPAERKAKGSIAEILDTGNVYPDKDVSILKIGATDLYTLPLGDDALATAGTRVFAVGYPGAATFSPAATTETALEASISSGTVSARRQLPTGFNTIQHNATIQGGSSGGPMVNDRGEIIGLNTYGVSDAGQAEFFFSVPSSLVKDFLDRRNIDQVEGPVTPQYIKALDQIDEKHFKDAQKTLSALNGAYPGRPYITDKLAFASQQIAAGNDESDDGFPMGILIAAVAAALALLLLIFLGVGLSRRGKRKKAADLAPVGAYDATSPYATGTPLPPPSPYGQVPPAQPGTPTPGLPGTPQTPYSEPPAYTPPPSAPPPPSQPPPPPSQPPPPPASQPAPPPPPPPPPPGGYQPPPQ